MNHVNKVEFKEGSREEKLPDFMPEFPYISSFVEVDKFINNQSPWHWHRAVELFYIKEGCLTYFTPQKTLQFPAGSAGIINSNVLHMTKNNDNKSSTIQLIHLFDPVLISGQNGSLIDQKYVQPFVGAYQIDLFALFPENESQKPVIEKIQRSFEQGESIFAPEIQIRTALSDIWCDLFRLSEPMRRERGRYSKLNDKVKQMMIYIHEHYAEKISVREVALAAYISQRECFRAFNECLHMTPVEYIRSYRLQIACQLLVDSNDSLTAVSQACGLGSSSYFGEVFHEAFGCTPREYRRNVENQRTKLY